MNVSGIDRSSIDAMLARMKEMSSAVQSAPGQRAESVTGPSFRDALAGSLRAVSDAQVRSESLGKSFALGDDSVSLSDVMIASQKAGLAFQATVQVRNKLVSAYSEVMSMQV